MTLMQLQYFKALAQSLNYTRTAEELRIAQPSLSYAIGALEKDLGAELFIREKKRVRLSPFGECFLPFAERTLATLEEGVRAIRQLQEAPESSMVTLGYFYSISSDFIPSIVEGFQKRAGDGDVSFRFAQHMNKDLLSELKAGRIDLAFCVTADREVECTKIGEQPLYVVVPNGHRLAGEKSLSVQDLAREKLVLLHKSSGLRATVEELFSDEGVPLHIAYETQECNSALQFVSIGGYVTIMPKIPAMELQAVTAIPLSGRHTCRSIFLAWRKNEELSSGVRRVRDFVLEEWSDMSASIFTTEC